MKLTIKDKEYQTGRLVMHHAIVAMEVQAKIQSGEVSEIEAVDMMVDILAESLINGTEKVPYDEITLEKKNDYKKLITYNISLGEIEPIYVELLNEMSGKHASEAGK